MSILDDSGKRVKFAGPVTFDPVLRRQPKPERILLLPEPSNWMEFEDFHARLLAAIGWPFFYNDGLKLCEFTQKTGSMISGKGTEMASANVQEFTSANWDQEVV